MGCMYPGRVGSLPHHRPVRRSLLWSEGWGFPRGLHQTGWVQVRVFSSAASCCVSVPHSLFLAEQLPCLG